MPILLILAWGLWRLLPGLDHPMIASWDESVHQAATRGTHDSFFFPHIYRDPLYPVALGDWLHAHVFLHKPTAPFWFGALTMHLTGVSTFALRFISLLGELLAACALFFIVRRVLGGLAGTVWAVGVALAFLTLPFGWDLTHGYQFGDVTDCTLAGWLTLAMALLCAAIESGSWRWVALAGAATGIAYLCKSALALAPIGVAGALCVLHHVRICRGLDWKALLALVASFIVVAAPWNVYCAVTWPDLYRLESEVTHGPPPREDHQLEQAGGCAPERDQRGRAEAVTSHSSSAGMHLADGPVSALSGA